MATEANPTNPPEVGEMVRDTRRQVFGILMGNVGGRLQLRPVAGGLEWDAQPEHVRSLTQAEILSARVSEANARSHRL